MESFRVIKPHPVLASYIKQYWILEVNHFSGISERIIPTGCVSLVFHKQNLLFSSKDSSLQPRTFICGQSTNFTDLTSQNGIKMIVVDFYPFSARLFLNEAINEFQEYNVSVDDINDIDLNELQKKVEDNNNDYEIIELIETFLIHRLSLSDNYHIKRITEAVRLIESSTELSIKKLSEETALSNKHFTRVFSEYVGITPKGFHRIVRFQKSLFLLQQNIHKSLTEVALHSGYYDQSHMIREFICFSGYTPQQYINACLPYSDYFSTT